MSEYKKTKVDIVFPLIHDFLDKIEAELSLEKAYKCYIDYCFAMMSHVVDIDKLPEVSRDALAFAKDYWYNNTGQTAEELTEWRVKVIRYLKQHDADIGYAMANVRFSAQVLWPESDSEDVSDCIEWSFDLMDAMGKLDEELVLNALEKAYGYKI